MFTVEQVRQAHSKIRNGSDFPAYVRDIQLIGVHYYETYVADRHTEYFGVHGFKVSTRPEPEILLISNTLNVEQFRNSLLIHQRGRTNYLTFCRDCARAGIEKWAVSLERMTCTYFDKSGAEILTEIIA